MIVQPVTFDHYVHKKICSSSTIRSEYSFGVKNKLEGISQEQIKFSDEMQKTIKWHQLMFAPAWP